jgi:CrcB protein
MTWLAVIVGAAVGAPLRYLIDRGVTSRVAGPDPIRQFPWGLLVVNVSGSALAGIVLAATTGDLRILLLTGFCGAYTTFSGFGWEVDRLWTTARGAFWTAVIVMPAACVVAFALAWRATSMMSS